MASDAEERQEDWESIDDGEEDLDGDDGVDEAGQQLPREDRVFFHEFREVVQAGC